MTNTTDFYDLVKKVESKEYLLPDFQRGFVWTDEEQQKGIVASVMSKMPIGNILLLEANSKEYACKYIGCNIKIENGDVEEKVSFLLDGQQRITVLTNVFSNVIHYNTTKVTDLASTSLKRRFFIRIPKWQDVHDNPHFEGDLFGVRELMFPYSNPDNDIPDFLSGDIERFIECISFKASDGQPYNPAEKLTTTLDSYCVNNKDGYLIPLFLMIPAGKSKQVNQTKLRYSQIIERVYNEIRQEIQNYYAGLSEKERSDFCDVFFKNESTKDLKIIKSDIDIFNNVLEDRSKVWGKDLENYLNSCVKYMVLNEVIVSEQERKRAIDIYENMNKGGVSPNTFDLIMARVAIVNSTPFMERLYTYIDNDKKYKTSLIDDSLIRKLVDSKIESKIGYNASTFAKVYTGADKQLVRSYIDSFLDVLSLLCNNPAYNTDETKDKYYRVEQIKKNTILELTPEQIDENAEKVCIALDRALFLLEMRCGIRNIKDINNSLILVIIATIFTNDKWFDNKNVHSLLEAWYWSAIFSGEFDKDQNAAMIRNLVSLINVINGVKKFDWITNMKDNVLKTNNFSDKALVLMKKASSEDREPKGNLRDFICQYWLSKTYSDMFDGSRTISVLFEGDSLEAHHIVPLGTATSYEESTSNLRKNKKNILNSPINFILITKAANISISDDTPSEYFDKITNQAKSSLQLTGYNKGTLTNPDAFLENRFDLIQGEITREIHNLLLGLKF